MSNFANSLSAVGRHNDALMMREKVLELFRRCFTDDHPNIGTLSVCSARHRYFMRIFLCAKSISFSVFFI